MKVCCIIVTYNGEKWITKCLHSVFHSSVKVDVIVIDNGSKDNTIRIIKAEYPEVDMIISQENLGFGAGNNVGIKKAIGRGVDYVFLLNQDAWIEHNALEDLIQAHQKNSEFGILSPMHVNADYSALDFNFSRYINPDDCVGLYSDIYLNRLKYVYECKFVNAAAWLISIECIQKVGLFDPLFFHYGEDRNFCQRVLHHKYKIGIVPAAKVVHDRQSRNRILNYDQKISKEKIKYLVRLGDVGLSEKAFRKKYTSYLLKNIILFWRHLLLFDLKESKKAFNMTIFLIKQRHPLLRSRKHNLIPGSLAVKSQSQ